LTSLITTKPKNAPLAWLREAPIASRRALLAASLGWMLDSFDIMLYALVLPAVMASLHLSKPSAGLLGSLTLIAGAAGGVLFGFIADLWGRTRALIASVLLYALFTAACGLAWSFASLAVFRILLGFGMGGEWASGASLVSETWAAEHRDKALGLMQSSFAIGYGLAAIVSFLVQPIAGWRGVFFVGLIPALLTLWIRRSVPEPEAWQIAIAAQSVANPDPQATATPQAAPKKLTFRALFQPPFLVRTVTLSLMNACCLFAWWGFNLWVPSYLSLPTPSGGIGLSPRIMTAILVAMQTGMWIGYISFGYLATAFGRRRVYVTFLVTAACLLVVFAWVRSPWLLVLLTPCLAFTATGYFSGFAAITADTFPAIIRARAQGLTYNFGRLASAAAPFAVGALAQRHGFHTAFYMDAFAFLLAAALWIVLPNPKTRQP